MKRRISLLLAALLLAASASARRTPIEIAGYILDGRIVSAETFDAADTEPATMYNTREAKNAPCVLVASTRSGSKQSPPSYTWVENVNINGVKALQADNIDRIRKELISTVHILPADKAAERFGDDARDGAIVVTLRRIARKDPAHIVNIGDIFYPRAESKRLTGTPTRITGNRTSDDKGPLIVLRSGGKEYTATSWPVVETNAVKSVTVLKDNASRSLFETYGDTSKGVILVDLRENAELPADARIIRIPSKSDASQSADTGDKAAAKPLMLVTDGQSVPKAAKTLDTIKAEDVESMTIIKNDDARKYDSYGDTSKGVILVKFKAGRLPKRFE